MDVSTVKTVNSEAIGKGGNGSKGNEASISSFLEELNTHRVLVIETALSREPLHKLGERLDLLPHGKGASDVLNLSFMDVPLDNLGIQLECPCCGNCNGVKHALKKWRAGSDVWHNFGGVCGDSKRNGNLIKSMLFLIETNGKQSLPFPIVKLGTDSKGADMLWYLRVVSAGSDESCFEKYLDRQFGGNVLQYRNGKYETFRFYSPDERVKRLADRVKKPTAK